jgi:NADH-quinone oxidoreductase subunit L
VLWIIAAATALITAYYMFRLLFLVFTGRSRYDNSIHPHESPKVMMIPLALLALLSFAGGMLNIPAIFGGSEKMDEWLHPVFASGNAMLDAHPHLSHATEWLLMGGLLIGVFAAAFLAYKKFSRDEIIEDKGKLANVIRNKFYVDEIYDALFAKTTDWFSGFFHKYVEKGLIDGIVNGVGSLVLKTGSLVRYIQTGNVGFYLFVMVFSIIGILIYNILIR